MNKKKAYRPDPGETNPEYLREIDVASGSKTYRINRGTLLSVHRRPGLRGGKYAFLYAEKTNVLTEVLIHVEGPDSRIVSQRYRKIIRESDIKTVHISTRSKG